MLYLMESGKIRRIEDKNISLAEGKKYAGAYSYQDAFHYAKGFGISHSLLEKTLENKYTRFESREEMDILCIPMIDFKDLDTEKKTMHLFLSKERFYIVCEDSSFVENIFRKISEDETSDVSFGRLLYDFLEKIFEEDNEYLDVFEEKIMNLENEVIIDKKRKNYVNHIIAYRKRLVVLKRYYEQFTNLFYYIEVNENGMFDRHSLKMLKILAGKTERLHSGVLMLIEYVTQIREAYQAEVDINLNTTMKLFTVVTTIFLPLTLIAGWYGMNFDMPEYHFAFSYPILILVSLSIVIFTVTYFKKNKWF